MPFNKKRLYIALYPSGVINNEERKYHWGFLIGPKIEQGKLVPGTRHHVINIPDGWKYEQVSLNDVRSTATLLVRILIAKIEDEDRLVALFRQLPVVQKDPNWRCRSWVKSALDAIAKDGMCVGTAELDWSKIEAIARDYVAKKAARGRFAEGIDMRKPKPTWDIVQNKEIVE